MTSLHARWVGAAASRSKNPFDDDVVSAAALLGSDAMQESKEGDEAAEEDNPFTLLERCMQYYPLPERKITVVTPEKQRGMSQPALVSSSSSPRSLIMESRSTSRTDRAGSKASITSARTLESSDSDPEEEDDDADEEDDSSGDESSENNVSYGPDSIRHDAIPGKHRALVFMETDVPCRMECIVRISEGGAKYELLTAKDNRLWMKAHRRMEGGLKRRLGGLSVSFWVSPLLLMDYGNSHKEVSFIEVMRELELVSELETQAIQQKSLRAGKLDGNARNKRFQLFGQGKSLKQAKGLWDVRAEFMGVSWSGPNATVALPTFAASKPRPMKPKEFLLRRLARGSRSVRRVGGSRTTSPTASQAASWTFADESHPETILVTIKKNSAEEYAVEFFEVAPITAFALTILASLRPVSTSLLRTASSLTNLLPRRNSVRRDSISRNDASPIHFL